MLSNNYLLHLFVYAIDIFLLKMNYDIYFYAVLSVVFIFIVPLGGRKAPKCSSMSIPGVSESVIKENRHLTRQMNKYAKLLQLHMVPATLPKDSRTTKLSLAILDLASEVVKSACPNHFTPHKGFIDRVLNAFVFIHDNGGDTRYFGDPITPEIFERIAVPLTACKQSVFSKGYYYFSSGGEDSECPVILSTIRQVCRVNSDYDLDVIKCQNLKLRDKRREEPECFHKTNLIIDVVWSIIDFVHVACFREFQIRSDISAFHFWEQALEELFTIKIRKYWYQAMLSTEMYQSIIHNNIKQQMLNLEMCLEGISLMIPDKMPRLQRPTYPLLMYGKRRKKRSNKEVNTTKI